MLRARFFLLFSMAILVSFAQGCGGNSGVHSPRPIERPAMESQYPVLQWVPANADFVFVTNRIQDGIEVLDQVTPALQEWGVVIPNVSEAESLLGGGVHKAATWQKIGVDVQATASVFGIDEAITLIVPTADTKLAQEFFGTLARDGRLRPDSGYEIADMSTDYGLLSVVSLEGAIAIHWDVAMHRGHGWIDDILSASKGEAYSSGIAAQAALSDAVRTSDNSSPAFWGSANGLFRNLAGNREWLACAGILAHVQGVSFSGEFDAKSPSVRFQVALKLQPNSASVLRSFLTAGPSAGLQILRQDVGFYASVGVDLAAVGDALTRARCTSLADKIASPLASVGWSPPPTSVHVAGSKLNVSKLSGDIALEVGMKTSDFVDRLLGTVPGRSWMESTKTIAGEKVTKLSIPTMSSLYYQLSETFLRFANQKNTMSKMIASEAGSPGELVAIGIQPRKIPQLRSLIELVLPAMASFWDDRLRRLDHIRLRVILAQNRLVFTGSLATIE